MICLGVDVGGTSVKAAALKNGRCLWTSRSAVYRRPSAEELRKAIADAVGNWVADFDRVGLCVPGILDQRRSAVTLSVNVPGLVGLPLDRLVLDSLKLSGARPTTILNDAHAAALDIFYSRNILGRLLVLSLGTGVGAAVLDDGKPLPVEGDSPGHLGQMDVSIAGHDVIGPDGGAGGLEGYIGAAAIGDRIDSLRADDPAILALVRAIRIGHAIYRPNWVWLCGGIGIRLRRLLPGIRELVGRGLTSVARAGWTLECGEDDFHAARGAGWAACLAND
ncbi:MAG: ROK family protein [Tepidisphaeraceae bacterium]